jgi:DNA-directed RNA polymerase specialized sigma24 family protein
MAKEQKCKPCGESSPYREWVDKYGFAIDPGRDRDEHMERKLPIRLREAIAKGDPDTLAVPEPENVDSLLQAILDVLDEGGEQVLTTKQRWAFQLIVREGLSYRETARKMRISVTAVVNLVKAGAKKLRILALTK